MRNLDKIINAKPATIKEYIKCLIKFKSLIFVFAKQEISAMYAQTYFGLFWVIIRPLFTLGIFTIIFHSFLHVATRMPYYLFAFTGIIAWNLFAQIAVNASAVVVQKQNLIRKMYFPKLILPISKILVALVETVISLMILFLLLFTENVRMGTNLLYLPIFLFLNISSGFALAVWMNALNIKFRDLNQILPTFIGISVWMTPVFYPEIIVPNKYKIFTYLNPMASVIKGYRFAILGEPSLEFASWWSLIFVVIIMFLGVAYFVKMEDKMVDYA